MSIPERVRVLVEPLVAAEELEVYDLELTGGVLRVLVDRPGGVGLDDITALTRELSRALDHDDPLEGRYVLEVSSPGVERPLRTPAHFAAAVGSTVGVKTRSEVAGDRRVEGTLTEADDAGIVVAPTGAGPRRLRYDEIERARTVFEWGATPKPGGAKARKQRKAAAGTAAKKNDDKKVTSP
jgi:ribosome maturation factor RimP